MSKLDDILDDLIIDVASDVSGVHGAMGDYDKPGAVKKIKDLMLELIGDDVQDPDIELYYVECNELRKKLRQKVADL